LGSFCPGPGQGRERNTDHQLPRKYEPWVKIRREKMSLKSGKKSKKREKLFQMVGVASVKHHSLKRVYCDTDLKSAEFNV